MTPAEQFFRALYAGQTGILELRTFGPEESDQSPHARRQRAAASRLRDFVPVVNGRLEIQRVERFLQGCAVAGLGAFYGVALRTPSAPRDRKGDAAHCQTLTALFVDADFKHCGEAETRKRLAEYSTAPAIIVNSGGGLHPEWLLLQPFDLQTSYDDARTVLRRLAYTVAAIVDVSVSEPARVLRIPGSLNFKYDPPRPVVVEQLTDVRIDPADLRLIELTSSPGVASGQSSGVPFQMPATLSSTNKERHETLRRLLRSLQAHGVGIDTAITVCLMENTARCRPPLDQKELESYLRRASTYADASNFTRTPKTGWDLAGCLVDIGVSLDAVRVAVHAVSPECDLDMVDEATPMLTSWSAMESAWLKR